MEPIHTDMHGGINILICTLETIWTTSRKHDVMNLDFGIFMINDFHHTIPYYACLLLLI